MRVYRETPVVLIPVKPVFSSYTVKPVFSSYTVKPVFSSYTPYLVIYDSGQLTL
jgi:hypothetical protein